MSYVVVIADRVADAGVRLLRSEPDLEVVAVAGASDRLTAELERAHALLVRSDTQVTAERIGAAPHLMVIGRAGTGVDNIDVDAATRRGIAVLTAPGANTVSTAEHTVALLLSLVRHIPSAAVSMREGRWDRKQFAGSELFGKQLGIVGLGRVGIRVARVARAFGMSVSAHDPYLPRERADEIGAELLSLDEVLASSDVVTLHIPLTDETRHLMNRERLAAMKPGAVLVNAARGGLIDEAALLEALESGHLAAAALDVYDPEPLPADSPLRRSERLLLTPHLAASTAEAQDRVAVQICSFVRDALLTGALRGAVNLPGISADVLARIGGALELARRLGRLAASLVASRLETMDVTFGGGDESAPRPVMLAALEGALTAMGLDRVTLVNANELARQRGIRCTRQVGRPLKGFETTVGVTAESESARVSVVGAVVGDGVGRLIRIDQYGVDVPAEGCVLILRNRDVPGVIGKVGQELGAASINIASYHQSRGAEAGGDALAAIVVDQIPSASVIEALETIPEIVDVRVARLDG